jgi:hypothetical protein
MPNPLARYGQAKPGSGTVGNHFLDALFFDKKIEQPVPVPPEGFPPVFGIKVAQLSVGDRVLVQPNLLVATPLQTERLVQGVRLGLVAGGVLVAQAGRALTPDRPRLGRTAMAIGIGSAAWHAYEFWTIRNIQSFSMTDVARSLTQ